MHLIARRDVDRKGIDLCWCAISLGTLMHEQIRCSCPRYIYIYIVLFKCDFTAISLRVASWPSLKPLETGFGIEPRATVCFHQRVHGAPIRYHRSLCTFCICIVTNNPLFPFIYLYREKRSTHLWQLHIESGEIPEWCQPNLYRVLGIRCDFPTMEDADELKRAYKRRSLQFHPDKPGGADVSIGEFHRAIKIDEYQWKWGQDRSTFSFRILLKGAFSQTRQPTLVPMPGWPQVLLWRFKRSRMLTMSF